MTVTAILKGTIDSKGLQTVFIRKSVAGRRTYKATSLKVKPRDFKKGTILPSHPNHKLFNQKIRAAIARSESGQEVKIADSSFENYVTNCLNEWDKAKAFSTLRNIKGELSKFLSFAQPKLSEITPDILRKYHDHCYKLGNKPNTVWDTFKFLRMILNKAERERKIEFNPFRLFEMPKYRDPEKYFLTKEQVEEIEKIDVPEFQKATTWFVIGCYTGLRYSDQRKFDKKMIRSGRLIIYTSKTGQPVSIKLNDKLKELFEKVDYKPIPYTNEHYNRILKNIGAMIGVDNLTCHVSRHTFGTLCASAGISQEVTAKLMGHSSIRTTSIYYKLTSDRIDSELDRLF